MTENPRPLRVFLCHASGDKPAVRELYKKLSASGYQPWLDEEDLLPGQDWEREISLAVSASDVVLVCLSQASTTKRGFVQKEIKFALDVADQQPEGIIFVIPARLEECDVPERIYRWHWVNLYEDRGYEKLLKSLELRATALQPKLEKGVPEGSAAPDQSRFGPTIPAVSNAAEIVHGEPPRTPDAPRGETFGFETVTLDETGKVISRRRATARQFVEELAPGLNLELVAIPGGTFIMGSPKDEESSFAHERPQHEVTVSPFHVSKYTVTQSQWRVVASWTKAERDLKAAPSLFKGEARPVE